MLQLQKVNMFVIKMKQMFTVAFLLAVTCGGRVVSGSWGYGPDNGPDTWSSQYPYCGGEGQSPVNIDSSDVWYSSSLHTFEMENYDHIPAHAHWELVNTGQTLVLEMGGGDYWLREGGYSDDYKLSRLEWHWGRDDSLGAEHSIDNKGGPAEMQMVHYNAKYKSYEEALQNHDGIIVLAFLYMVGKEENAAYHHIFTKLANVSHPGDRLVLRPLPLLSLLPGNLNTYYRYQGSLTTPPCVEGISWTLFTHRVELSRRQLKALRSKLFETERVSPNRQVMSPPLRPQRPVGMRAVYSNIHEHATVFSSPLSSPVSITLAVFFGFVLLFVFMRI